MTSARRYGGAGLRRSVRSPGGVVPSPGEIDPTIFDCWVGNAGLAFATGDETGGTLSSWTGQANGTILAIDFSSPPNYAVDTGYFNGLLLPQTSTTGNRYFYSIDDADFPDHDPVYVGFLMRQKSANQFASDVVGHGSKTLMLDTINITAGERDKWRAKATVASTVYTSSVPIDTPRSQDWVEVFYDAVAGDLVLRRNGTEVSRDAIPGPPDNTAPGLENFSLGWQSSAAFGLVVLSENAAAIANGPAFEAYARSIYG